MKKVKILLTIFAFCLVSSCGFLSDDPVKDQGTFTSEELNSSCTLDPDQFGDILDINIEEQIACLESNFNQFRDYVQSSDRDNISESELTNFVRRFFKDNSNTIIQGLKLIFELNMLLLKDEADSISRDNISPLFELLVNVNRQAIIVTKALKKMQDEKDPRKIFGVRKELMKALQDFTDASLAIISGPDQNTKSINLKEFLLNLNDRIDLGNNSIDEKFAEAILFIKKVFLGGDRDILTSAEIERAIEKLPRLVTIATDLTFINEDHFKNKVTYFGFQQNILKRLNYLIEKAPSTEVIFKLEDLFVIFDRMSGEEKFNLRDYEKVFKSVKQDLIGGSETEFTYKELKYLITYLDISLEGLKFYETDRELTKDINLKSLEEKLAIKEKYLLEVDKRIKGIEKRLNYGNGLPPKVNILNFAKTLSREIDGLDFNIEFIDAVFGVKILLAGGTKDQLSRNELDLIFTKTQRLASFYFDLNYINSSYKEDSSAKWNFLESVIEKVIPIIHEDESIQSISYSDLGVILKELFCPEVLKAAQKDLGGIKLDPQEVEAITRTLKEDVFVSSRDTISNGEIKSLLSITRLAMSGVELFQSYEEKSSRAKEDPQNLEQYITDIEQKAQTFNLLIQNNLDSIKYINRNLDYLKVARGLAPIFEDESLEEGEEPSATLDEYVENLSPLKSLVFGGTNATLSFTEVKFFATKIPSYLSALFRLSNTDLETEEDNELQWQILLRAFTSVKKNLVVDASLKYFTGKELMDSLNWFLNLDLEEGEEPVEYDKFTDTVLKFKGRVLHQIKNPKIDPTKYPFVHTFTAQHISKVLEWAHGALENLYFAERTYKFFENRMASRSKISYLNMSAISSYPYIRNSSINSLRKDFLYMTKTHRHYTKEIKRVNDKDEEEIKFIQYFGKDIERTRYGFVQLSIIRYALKKVILGYSVKQNGKDVVDVDRINMLLMDFKPVLEVFNLWTSNIETFGENAILLGDLFQNASDGDNAINIDEGTEYASMVIVAVTLGDEIMHKIKTECDNYGTDEDLEFLPTCYRPYFFDSWLNRLEYAKYFPKLNSYYRTSSRYESTDFVRKTEGFARDVDDEKLPMGIRDYTLLVGALLNIESTFVRFDLNNDNIIDTQELDKAFLIYKGSIIKIAELYGWKKMFAKTVFYYMVKNMKIPTETQVMKYHFQLNFNPMYTERIRAKRLNIGALLYNLIQYRSGTP
jgi:ribosomal protein S15P/S13E